MTKMPDFDNSVVVGDRANQLRAEIRDLIRNARRAKNLSQADLGSALGSNRFLIIRIEKGERDVTLDEAKDLDQALGLDQLATLVTRLHAATGGDDNQRDEVVRHLLATPALELVTIVIADDLDVYNILFDTGRGRMRVDAREIRVVVPTAEREKALFGSQPLWGFWEYQIKHLSSLQTPESGHSGTLRVYESDRVVCSAVIANTRTGTRSAFWAPLPIATVVTAPSIDPRQVEGGRLPVVATTDIETNERLRAHVGHVLAGRDFLRTNEALCRFANGAADPTFTRYFAKGSDEEEEVAVEEGLAISLVLATARCPRRGYGVGRRVIMYKRLSSHNDRGMLSLFSNPVDDADIRAARAIEEGTEPDPVRSTRGALEASLETDAYLETKAGVIPDLAFQIAATRELAMFGLSVAPDRLKRVRLPRELQLIHKSTPDGRRRAGVAAHLFTLDLELGGRPPELDVLSEGADSEVIGIEDIEESEQLNDFLVTARGNGFLRQLLEGLGVAAR
jgi:transcriptional regulator with XRE-family HTH domain